MKAIFCLLLGAASVSPAFAATLVVVEARGIAFKPGATLDAAKPLVLKQGQHVTLISEAGATLKLDGPYDRPPAAQSATGVDLSTTLKALITQRQARNGEYGTTRGTTVAALPDPWVMDVTHGGTVCLREKQLPEFWRPDAKDAVPLHIAPVDRSWRVSANWHAGQSRMMVTEDVPMRGGDTYVLNYGEESFAITMILLPGSLTNDQMRAAWMADRNCDAQAQALLKTMQ